MKPETSRDGSQSSSKLDLVISFSLLSSPNPVPNPSHKSRSQIQVQIPKSKVQRKRNGTGADNIIQQATTQPTTHPPLTFLTWNVNLVMGKDHPWPSLTFFDLTWPSKFFYDLLRSPWPSMIKCQLSKPGLISGPLKPKPKLILTEFQGLTLSTPSLVSSKCFFD